MMKLPSCDDPCITENREKVATPVEATSHAREESDRTRAKSFETLHLAVGEQEYFKYQSVLLPEDSRTQEVP
jgi:hypothetical protein